MMLSQQALMPVPLLPTVTLPLLVTVLPLLTLIPRAPSPPMTVPLLTTALLLFRSTAVAGALPDTSIVAPDWIVTEMLSSAPVPTGVVCVPPDAVHVTLPLGSVAQSASAGDADRSARVA